MGDREGMMKRFISSIFAVMLYVGIGGADKYEIQWADTISDNILDRAYGIAIDKHGNVIVAGNYNNNWYTVKYDSSGNILWSNTINDGYYSGARSIALNSKNNIIATGSSCVDSGGSRYWYTVKYDSLGTVLWTLWDTTGETGSAWDVAIDGKENVLLIGKYGNCHNYIVKFDSLGNFVWADTSAVNFYFRGVAVDYQDNIIITGYKDMYRPYVYTMKLNSSGNILWMDTIDASDNFEWARAWDIAVDLNNNIIIAGELNTGWPNYYGYYHIVKYDSLGRILWADTLDDGESATAMAVDKDGNIVATGWSFGAGYYTVKYNPSGSILWSSGFDAERAYGVAVDEYSNIIVTGSPYITVKYRMVTGIEEKIITDNCNIVVYPNPFITCATIRRIDELEKLVVSDLAGRVVEIIEGAEFGKNLSPGVYFIRAKRCEPIKIVKLR